MPKGQKRTEDDRLSELNEKAKALTAKIAETQDAKARRLAREDEAECLQLGRVAKALIASDEVIKERFADEAAVLAAAGDLFLPNKRAGSKERAVKALERVLGPLPDPGAYFSPAPQPEPEDLGDFVPSRPRLSNLEDAAE